MADDLATFLAGQTFLREPQADPSRSAWAYSARSVQRSAEAAPSRGGSQHLTFHENGTFEMTTVGRDDRPRLVHGDWRVDPVAGNQAELRSQDGKTIGIARRTDDDRIIIDYSLR